MSEPMYVRIADELAGLVQSGQIKGGDRLPSVRSLVRQKGVSASTAVAALRAVEHRGLAVARPQSGYFAKPAHVGVAEPVTTRPRATAHSVGVDSVMVQVIDASRDPAIAPLGAAAPDPDLFPTSRLQRIVASVARRNPRLMGQYGLDYHGVASRRHRGDRVPGVLLHTPGAYERHLAKLRGTYARQVAQMAAAVSHYFPSGTRMTQPRGGFVIWVELPRGIDSRALFEVALRQGVNFAPGPLFSATGRYGQFLRLNCGRRWTPALEAAAARLGRLAAAPGNRWPHPTANPAPREFQPR